MTQQYYYIAPSSRHGMREEYRALSSHSIFAGMCFLGSYTLQEILVFILALFGFTDELSTNLSFQYAVSALPLTVFAMAMPFFIYSLRKGRPSYIKALPFHSPVPFGKLLLVIVAGFGLCLASNYIANLSGIIFSLIGAEGDVPETQTSQNALDVVMNFIVSAAVAPLIEEFIFRGVLMQPLRRYGDFFAVISSSVIFGLAHGRPTNIVFAFLAGIVIGCAVVYTRSLWAGIIIHALNNGFSVFFSELESVASGVANISYLIACAVVILVGIIAFIIYAKKYGLRMSRGTSNLNTGLKILGFYASVPMILVRLYYYVAIISNLIR